MFQRGFIMLDHIVSSLMFEVELLSKLLTPEYTLAIGGFVLNLLILPTILDGDAAVPRTQSVLSAVVLLVCFAVPYYWIGFYASAASNMIGVVLWTVVAMYRAPTQSSVRTQQSTTSSKKEASHAD